MKNLLRILTLVLLATWAAPGSASAQESAAGEPDTAESIAAENFETPNEFDDKGDEVRKTKVTFKAEPRDSNEIIVVKETADTVFVVNTSDFRSALREGESKIGVFRERGYGISGGPTPGLYAIDLGPVKDLVKLGYPILGASYDFGKYDYEYVLMNGGMGYVGLGNGLRIGGGGMGGRRNFASEIFGGDSIAEIRAHVGFGGVLIEKAGIKNQMNYLVGGLIGGGSYEVSHSVGKVNDFFHSPEETLREPDYKAKFFSLEFHGGFTYSFMPFMHIGVDLSLPLFMSLDGFSPVTGEFATVNTGLRARFIFGNLG